MNKTHEIIIEVTGTGLSAYVAELDGVVTTGENLSEIKENITEALELYYEDEDKKVKLHLVFRVDFKQFFKHYSILNQKALSAFIGINNTLMSQYIRGTKVPSGKQLEKISKGINSVGKELAEIHF